MAENGPKTNQNFFVSKCPIILPKFGRKSVENQPIFGPKKAPGLSGFLDRASGGPGLAKMGRAGRAFKPGPRPDPSLTDSAGYPIAQKNKSTFKSITNNSTFECAVNNNTAEVHRQSDNSIQKLRLQFLSNILSFGY